MDETLKRVQMLLKPEQHRALVEVANRQKTSVAKVTRQVIDLGLAVMESQDEFLRREGALHRAETVRKAMRQRRGQPLDIDIVADLQHMREERDDYISGRSG
jgi:hypothetical protein